MPALQDDDEHSNYVVDILTVDDVTYTTGWDDTLKSWRDGKVVSSVKLPSQPKQLGSIKGAVLSCLNLHCNCTQKLTSN